MRILSKEVDGVSVSVSFEWLVLYGLLYMLLTRDELYVFIYIQLHLNRERNIVAEQFLVIIINNLK